MKTINITGTGSVKTPVDYVVIEITLKSISKDYEEALDKSQKKLKSIRESLVEIGYEKEDLKTDSFLINSKYKPIRNLSDDYEEEFVGYEVIHTLELGLDFCEKRLAKTLSQISNSNAEPKINIEFTSKNSDAIKEKLIKSATKDAKKKAELLAREAGVELGELVTINYTFNDISDNSPIEFRANIIGADFEMTPKEIESTENINFTWEIK